MNAIKRALDVLRHEGPRSTLAKIRRRIVTQHLAGTPAEHLLILRALDDQAQSRCMIDVGAATGNTLAAFVAAGWTVHAFEPDPRNLGPLRRMFGEHELVTINDVAVSNRAEKEAEFYTSDRSVGLSSLLAFDASHKPSGTVEVITLRSYHERHTIGRVDFLKVDTEGADLLVLQGYPWSEAAPKVVMCEFDDAKSRHFGYTWQDMADFLAERGYQVLVSEWYPLQQYGRGHRWRAIRAYPCSLAQAEAWGNLIAAKGERTLTDLTEQFAAYEKRRARLAALRRLLSG